MAMEQQGQTNGTPTVNGTHAMNGTKETNGVHPPSEFPPRRIWLHSNPRTASNMFFQMMSKQPNFLKLHYEFFFAASMPTMEKFDTTPFAETSEEFKQFTIACHQEALEKLIEKVESAESKGQSVFFKEHSWVIADRRTSYENGWQDLVKNYQVPEEEWKNDRWLLKMPGKTEGSIHTNPTMLPDEFLQTWLPVFLIRHPAKAIPSAKRCLDVSIAKLDYENPTKINTFRAPWSRRLYDWYIKNGVAAAKHLPVEMREAWPIVIDTDDVLMDKAVLTELCRASGMDASEIQYEWAAKTQEELKQIPENVRIMVKTLHSSSGVLSSTYAGDMDIDAEMQKWVVEFGEDTAKLIRGYVDESMEDYEYLKARKLRAH